MKGEVMKGELANEAWRAGGRVNSRREAARHLPPSSDGDTKTSRVAADGEGRPSSRPSTQRRGRQCTQGKVQRQKKKTAPLHAHHHAHPSPHMSILAAEFPRSSRLPQYLLIPSPHPSPVFHSRTHLHPLRSLLTSP